MSKSKSVLQKSVRPSAKRARPGPDVDRSYQDDLVSARRKVCTHFGFWRACGYKRCRHAKSCTHPSNECFGHLWPLVPQSMKQGVRAGLEAKAAELPAAEIDAAIERAMARCREAEAISAPDAAAPPLAAPVPAQPIAARTRIASRVRVL
jgi:hypothetical protein